MRVIGLLGGMSWESTAEYYRMINQEVRRRLGRQHSAKIVMYSVDFEEIEQLQSAGDWETAGRILADAAQGVERGGAELLVLCTNTMHKVAPAIEASIDVPLIHIADATAEAVLKEGLRCVGLLGTRFTMQEDFYKGRLAERHGLEVLVPPAADQEIVDRVIYDELCLGEILDVSRREYVTIIRGLGDRGAKGIILGCTEIGLLVRPEDSPLTVFDTTRIHSAKTVEAALSD